MKLRSKKKLDGDGAPSAEAGAANVTPPDPFEKGEQTLNRPDGKHYHDLKGSGNDSELESVEASKKTSERSEAQTGEELLFEYTSRSKNKYDSPEKRTVPSGQDEKKRDDIEHKSLWRGVKFESEEEYQHVVWWTRGLL